MDLAIKNRATKSDISEGTEHFAIESEMVDRHLQGEFSAAYKFARIAPILAIGRNQVFEREARIEYCRQNNIKLIQRLTAGGAIYIDENQICFSIIMPKKVLGENIAARLENATISIANALKPFGLDAEFKAPNDLLTKNRQKIGSVFGYEARDSFLLFATIIEKLDLKSAMSALLVPTEKLTVTGLEHAKERMTALDEIQGFIYDKIAIEAAIIEKFEFDYSIKLKEFKSEDFEAHECRTKEWKLNELNFETKDKTEGATLRALIEIENQKVQDLRFATDGHFFPANSLNLLAHYLNGAKISDILEIAKLFFEINNFDAAGFGAADIIALLERVIAKHKIMIDFGLNHNQASGIMLAGGNDPKTALENANVMLVPYCAKPNWCKWRHTIDCVECGKCEVSDAYTMARERNMDVVTITNFEHLAETLETMKEKGVKSYVGMCCGEFFLKRHHAFRNSGMDAVLMDIEGATCYELKEEHLAYQGAFKAEAALDLEVVNKIMANVPIGSPENKPCITGIAVRPHERAALKRGCENCGFARGEG